EENPSALSILFSGVFEIRNLDYHRQVFYQEDPAQYRQHDLLAYSQRKNSDDAAKRKAARVAHEYLRREGIVPKETKTRSNKCGTEDHDLTEIRDIHDVQVCAKVNTT